MKKLIDKALWAGLWLLLLPVPFYAQQIPISVQGVVRNADGSIFPTGNYSMRFRIYNVATGGTAIWTEEQSGIRIEGGVYSVLIGKITSLGNIPFDQNLFLGVSVDGGTELTPRALFTAAPAARYAFRSPGAIPSGMVISFAGPLDNIPEGWLPCDGRALKSSDFPTLFDRIGTTYGNGSAGMGAGGGTNFNVPDLRGEFIRGLDRGRGIDANRTIGSFQDWTTARPTIPFNFSINAAGSHTHSTGIYNFSGLGQFISGPSKSPITFVEYFVFPLSGIFDTSISGGQTPTEGAHTHTITSAGGGDSETRPVNTAVHYFIKY